MTPLAIRGVDFVALPAQDIEASRHFYGTILGLPVAKRYAPGGGPGDA